eukprot:gene12276-16464_t
MANITLDLSSIDQSKSEGSLLTGRTNDSGTTEGSADENSNTFGQATKFVKKKLRAFGKNFVDYGPPYTYAKKFDPTLINECSKPVLNHVTVHTLLNTRMDPNMTDPEDLYYTATHWCARNLHFFGLKMLRKAGAKLDITNEMGHTPLDMCVMLKYPPDKRKTQLNMVRYMLLNNAPVNNRDKAGYSAIDFAASNQDLELINMLLDAGANVLRENYILVAKREHILKRVKDPACYKALYEKLLIEQAEVERVNELKQQIKAVVDEDKYYEDIKKSLSKNKLKKMERDKKLNDTKFKEELEKKRKEQIKQEMEENLQKKSDAKKNQEGLWMKENDIDDNWVLKERVNAQKITNEIIYNDSKKLMRKLKDTNKIENYNKQWNKLTGGGIIEAKWSRSEAFFLPELVDNSDNMSQQSKRSIMTGNSHSTIGGKKKIDVEFKDENDLALEGENIDDMLDSLNGL